MPDPKLLIFDFDGTLYPFPENCVDLFVQFAGQAVQHISGGLLSLEDAKAHGFKSYTETGLAFRRVAEDHGMHLGEAAAIHHHYARFDLEPDQALIDAFEALRDHNIIPIILTQGTRCNLDRHLPQIGLDTFFPRNMRLAIDQTGYDELKAHSQRPWLMAKIWAENVTGLKFDDKDIHVFEDTPDNLLMPHDMGWKTNLVHGGAPHSKLLPHIHRQMRTPAEILLEFVKDHAPKPDIQPL